MNDLTHASVLDLLDPMLRFLASSPPVRESCLGLDASLRTALSAGADWVQLSAAELGSNGLPGAQFGVDYITKAMPAGFITKRPRTVVPAAQVATSFSSRWAPRAANIALNDAAHDIPAPDVHEPEVVYHFDLTMLRAATPGIVANMPVHVEVKNAHAYQRRRRHG